MILVIDTSSALSAIAVLDADHRVVHEEVAVSGPAFDLPARFRALSPGGTLTRIAVATGPGSFTGLRVGVSFGLGLAMGMKIPIVPLPTLRLQASRSDDTVTAVAEAGRGRVYFLPPAGKPRLGEPGDLPSDWLLAGWVRPATEAALAAAGLAFQAEDQLRSFGAAAALLVGSAPEIPYESVKLEYMQSFSARNA